jgi:predicted O-linked N-acetylglucosamine transferase (SPINDLY family)
MFPDVGMNSPSRLLALHRMAPIQITAWGHPITTGSPHIDYFLSSDLMEPEDAQSHYSESLVRLPNLALFIKPQSSENMESENFDLPEGHILYGCLQSLNKYVPQYDFVIAEIAKKSPKSLFVFLEGLPPASTGFLKKRLSRIFDQNGLDFHQHVKFLPRVKRGQYVELISRMDVILDSIGWTGGNTSLEAIEQGKPIVTLPGQFMRGRHTYAMLKMMGLENHMSSSIDDYICRAVALGADDELRAQHRTEILERKELLYEDYACREALDKFLKSAVERRG